MSLSLLLEKYDVSTDEGLKKALNEIEKEESEVDEALTGVLSRACSLEGRLRTASQAYTRLGEVKNDARTAADMVEKTAALARDVSAKVRQLDLARSRVAECQRRVHDLIDLQLCSAGVEAAIKAHDYETGAAHVSRFLSMDPGSVAAAQARGAADPRDSMMKAADTLREHLVRKFEEAARKEDEVSVERLFKLFPQIGRAEEGVDLLAKFLAVQAEANIRRACVIPSVSSEAAVFADALTRVVEAAGAAVEKARLAATTAPGLLARSIRVIQPTVDVGVRRVYRALVESRRLRGRAPACALSAEPVLAELAVAHCRLPLYLAFIRRAAEKDAATLDEAKRKASIEAVEKIIAESDLVRTAQDLLGHYLELERFFLEQSVSKALKLAQPQPGATTSTLVDDVFYIARKVIRRSISTGSIDGACAVLNETASLLEREVAHTVRRWLRAPPPDPLPLAPPAHHCAAPDSVTLRLNKDVDALRLLYLVHMSEAEAGVEYCSRVADEAVAAAGPLCRGDTERGKVASCAAGLSAAAAAFRAAHHAALAALHAALAPRLAAWADHIVNPNLRSDDMEEDADQLPCALDQFVERSLTLVSAPSLSSVLHAALTDLTRSAERRITHHTYTRESGLCVERRARRLAAWAGAGAPAARDKAARLAQAAALLALEHPAHALDALRPAPRLSNNEARDILARRTDFKLEDIKRVKL